MIQSVNRKPVTSVANSKRPWVAVGTVLLLVNRGGATRFVAIDRTK